MGTQSRDGYDDTHAVIAGVGAGGGEFWGTVARTVNPTPNTAPEERVFRVYTAPGSDLLPTTRPAIPTRLTYVRQELNNFQVWMIGNEGIWIEFRSMCWWPGLPTGTSSSCTVRERWLTSSQTSASATFTASGTRRQITWNANGGTWQTPLVTQAPASMSGGAVGTNTNRTSSEPQGTTPNDLRPGVLTRPGYTFNGWSPSGAIPAANQTRTAQWTRIPPAIVPPLTATFHLNGGQIGTQGGTYTALFPSNSRVIQPRDPTRTGYVFRGWFTSATDNNEFNFNQTRTTDQTIHAQWEPITGNVVVLHFAGGLAHNQTTWWFNSEREQTMWLPSAGVMNQVTPGQTFLGWFRYADFSGGEVFLVADGAIGPQEFFGRWG